MPESHTQTLRGLGSMATKHLLAELASVTSPPTTWEATGGVPAEARIAAGEDADLIALAEPALVRLQALGALTDFGIHPLVVSEVAVAVPEGTPVPPLADETDVRAALLAAPRIAYSTGPSGAALLDLLTRLGISDAVGARLIQAPAGTPVASLLATGAADLGVQQLSELRGSPGVTVAGVLPGDCAIRTTFALAAPATTRNPDAAAHAIRQLVSPTTADARLAHGFTLPTEES